MGEISRMSKISKMDAFQCVVEAMDKNDYKTANEIIELGYNPAEEVEEKQTKVNRKNKETKN